MKSRLNEISELRERFKPSPQVKVLLIAESPPYSTETEVRFFYNPNQEKYDVLFKTIMSVLYSDFGTYILGDKEKYLERFRNDGFFLIDATDIPVNKLEYTERTQVIIKGMDQKVEEIKSLVTSNTPIILIKLNVFEIYNERLRQEGLNVPQNIFLPFPTKRRGLEKRFKQEFHDLLESIGITKA